MIAEATGAATPRRYALSIVDTSIWYAMPTSAMA